MFVEKQIVKPTPEMRKRQRAIHPGSFAGLTVKSFFIAGALAMTICGCSVQDNKNGHTESVRLHTPLGGLDVRTNDIHGPDVGLPVYPGAVETGKHGNESGSADIHMSFGAWRLNVKAVEYHSSDPEDKVVAFYKKAMAQYGDVLTCKDRIAIGEPSKTRQGLTCANDHEYDVDVKLDAPRTSTKSQTPSVSGNVKLLAGSLHDQHIVEFRPNSSGTKFTVVVVQLPHKSETD